MKNILTTLTLWLLYVPLAHAQDFGSDQLDDIADRADLKSAPLAQIIGSLIQVLIGLIGIIFLLLTIYAGFLYLTARGEEEKVTHAKDTLQRGVIGLVIVSAAYAIASFVINALVIATAASPSP